MTRQTDCLVDLFDSLLKDMPPLPAMIDGDRRVAWLSGLRQIIGAMPSEEQRLAAVILVSNQLLTLYPGVELSVMCGWMKTQLLPEEDRP
jgi:hypothetical protein